jgi:hypothetical protein
MTKKNTFLRLETLEDRYVPALVGTPWPYANLTLSFVPDGTSVDGNKSSLFQTMGTQVSIAKTWEAQILKAAQTWADAANINVGLVADGGQSIGASGLIQGDSRFGDIRVAAEPLGVGAQVAIGSPYNPIAGTRSGDLVFNSSYAFNVGGSQTSYDIYTVALHELGHSFGLPDNNDPTSIMYNTYQGVRTGPSAGDIAAIQSLYGTRAADAYQGPNGNNTLGTSAVMKLPEIGADISTVGQTDYFTYTVPSYADRTVTVTVQNGGISLLSPTLSAYTSSGTLIASSSAGSIFNNTTSITLNNVKRGMTLILSVASTHTDAFGMGSYRLKVDSGAVSRLQIAAIDAALNANTIVYKNFGHSTSTISTAVALDNTTYEIDPRFDYAVDARLGDASDVDFFSITTPATAPQATVFTVAPGQGSKLSPDLTVYDTNGNVVNAQILSNEASGYIVQILNPVAGAKYYLAVTADPFAATINDVGTYRLGITYTNSPIVLQTIVSDTLSATDTVDVLQVRSTEVQLYHFVLSVDTGGAAAGVEVQMQVIDANNKVVLSLTCQDGNTVSADVQLLQSSYTIVFTGINTNGSPLPTTWYSLLGTSLTENLDPVPIDPTDPTGTTTTTSGTTGTSGTTDTSGTSGTTTTTDTSTLLVISPPPPTPSPPTP